MDEELLTLGEVIDNISYGKIATSVIPESHDRGSKIFCGKDGRVFWIPSGSNTLTKAFAFRKSDDLELRRWKMECSENTKVITDIMEELL